MKKTLLAGLATSAAIALFAAQVSAADIKLSIKGKELSFTNGTPFIENGTSLVPLRDLLLGLGLSMSNIAWDGSTSTVTATLDGVEIRLKVGEKTIYRNGVKFKDLEVPAKLVDGRVYLPARAVAEALGNKVSYDSATKSVVIVADPNASTGGSSSGASTGGSSAGGSGSMGSGSAGSGSMGGPTGGSTGSGSSGGSGTGASPGGSSSGSPSGSQGGSGASSSSGATFTSSNGISLSLPSFEVKAGQVVGLVEKYEGQTGTITLQLADGTTRSLKLTATTQLHYANGHTYTGQEYGMFFHDGVFIAATVAANGNITEMSVNNLVFEGEVVDVSEHSFTAPDGTPVVILQVMIHIDHQYVTVTGDNIPNPRPEVGDTVRVNGTFVDANGENYGSFESMEVL